MKTKDTPETLRPLGLRAVFAGKGATRRTIDSLDPWSIITFARLVYEQSVKVEGQTFSDVADALIRDYQQQQDRDAHSTFILG